MRKRRNPGVNFDFLEFYLVIRLDSYVLYENRTNVQNLKGFLDLDFAVC